MKPSSDFLFEIAYWFAVVLLMMTGSYLLIARFQIAPSAIEYLNKGGGELLVVWGILSFALIAYFIIRIIQIRRRRARIMSPGPRGPIWISPDALREFVHRTLEEELGLSEAQVKLRMKGAGVGIHVRTAIPLSETITDLGERIQECVKTQVESKIGVEVDNIEVYASNITAEALPPALPEEEYTPLEFPERDESDE
jgi:hypothetical protein